jgi:hypothetical protein
MIEKKAKERLQSLTVEVILEMRRAYLQTSTPNILKHWDLLQNRMLAAARTTSGPEEWATSVARGLHLEAASSSYSRCLLELTHAVHEQDVAREWLDLIESEHAFLIVMTRRIAEERKEQALAEKEAKEESHAV